jgi:hypothetical protein
MKVGDTIEFNIWYGRWLERGRPFDLEGRQRLAHPCLLLGERR